MISRSRGAMRPRFAFILRPHGGRGECRMPAAPAASCALVLVKSTRVTTSTPESPGIPARNGFTAYVALSPVTGLFCHRRLRIRGLSAPGRADLPSRRAQNAAASTASRPYVPDDHDTPLLRGGMRKVLEVIWGVRKPKYFCKGGWTSLSTNRPTGKSLEPVLLSALSVFARVPDTVQRALRRACP